jgi:hypothetical protein
MVIDPAKLGPIFIGLSKGLLTAVKNKFGREAGVIALFALTGRPCLANRCSNRRGSRQNVERDRQTGLFGAEGLGAMPIIGRKQHQLADLGLNNVVGAIFLAQ